MIDLTTATIGRNGSQRLHLIIGDARDVKSPYAVCGVWVDNSRMPADDPNVERTAICKKCLAEQKTTPKEETPVTETPKEETPVTETPITEETLEHKFNRQYAEYQLASLEQGFNDMIARLERVKQEIAYQRDNAVNGQDQHMTAVDRANAALREVFGIANNVHFDTLTKNAVAVDQARRDGLLPKNAD